MRKFEKVRKLLLTHQGLPLVWLVLSVLVLIPIWQQRLLPMLDVPNHLALIRGWHSFNDPSYHISEFYELRVRPVPYFFFYLSIHGLLYLFEIETANKIFLSVYLLLFPFSVLAMARVLGRSSWLAIGAFALAFNQNWIYGFASYLMGTCFMFFALAALIRFLREGNRMQAWWLLVATLLAYFGHVLVWFVFGLCASALLILFRKQWRRGLIASLAVAPTVALAFFAYIEDKGDRAYMKHGDTFTATWRDFPTSVVEFPGRVMELFPGGLDMWVLAGVAASIAALRVMSRGVADPQSPSNDRIIRILLLVMGVTYLSLPYEITKPMKWWYVSPRVPSMMAVLLLLLPSLRIEGKRVFWLAPLIVSCVVLPIKLATLYRDFSARNIAFMRLLEQVPRGTNTLVVVRGMMRGPGSEEKSGDPATSGPVYWHFSSWPMALKGGFGPYIFDQGIPIRAKKILVTPMWTTTDTFELRQAPEFDYYIVRYPPDDMDREPSLKLVERTGEWALYQRIHRMTDEP